MPYSKFLLAHKLVANLLSSVTVLGDVLPNNEFHHVTSYHKSFSTHPPQCCELSADACVGFRCTSCVSYVSVDLDALPVFPVYLWILMHFLCFLCIYGF